MTATATNNISSITPSSYLKDRVMLVFVRVRKKTFRKNDKAVSAEIAATKNADAHRAGDYHKRLIAKVYLKDLNSAATAIGNLFREYTLPWGRDGRRMLPSKNFEKFNREFLKLKVDYDIAVDSFIASYSVAVDEAKSRLGDMFNPGDYEDPATLRNDFEVIREIEPLNDGNDFRVRMNDSIISAIRSDIESNLNARVNEAVKDLWERLAKSITEMKEKLDDYDKEEGKRFSSAWVDNVAKVVELIPNLNFNDDPELEKMRKDIEKRLLSVDSEELKATETAREKAKETADDILNRIGAFL